MIGIRSLFVVGLQSVLITSLVFSGVSIIHAEVRSSSNYKLQSDSINFGGGLSESVNYSLESTVGEVATGDTSSSNYQLRAGYQQMQEVFLSMTNPGSVIMSPQIGGLTGGVANGSTSVSVLTDSPAGYELTIAAENSPAMQSLVGSIMDYDPAIAMQADFVFSTNVDEAQFGFSPEGNDVADHYLDNGSICGVGAFDTSLSCWDGLSVSEKVIAVGGSNQPTGTVTKIQFRLAVGSDAAVLAGQYVATTTLTAIPL